jgi:hypothetical protein
MAEHQHNDAILLCHDAEGAYWQFGRLPPRRGKFVLIGWTMLESDGGVPSLVANALARGLAAFGRVTFLCSAVAANRDTRWLAHGTDFVASFPVRALRAWRGLLSGWRGPKDLVLLSTVRAETVRGMFEDAVYPWWLHGQFALLSRPAVTPPYLAPHGRLLTHLVEPDWADAFSELAQTGVDAVFRPGVDGSVAGVLCTSSEILQEVEENICGAAEDFGLDCRMLSEDSFRASLAEGTDTANRAP